MSKNSRRVVGLDVHPDTFAGAILRGRDPATAQIEHTSTRVPLAQLEAWAERHTLAGDTLVLEASGNAFAVAARLRALERKAIILDSHQAGRVGKVYCANDRVDAVKIARIFLSGLSAQVWQPDAKTLERREVFSAYQSVVKEATRLKAADSRHAQTSTACACRAAFDWPIPRPVAGCSSCGHGAPPRRCCSSKCTRGWLPPVLGARDCAGTSQQR
jgi:hypothetical protein